MPNPLLERFKNGTLSQGRKPGSTFRVSQGFSASNVKDHTKEDGTGEITGIRVFKAGTFADSMGFRDTWTIVHLEQMIANFTYLVGEGIFPNVPVRADHAGYEGSVEKIVGYVKGLYRDPDDTNFLAMDLEITEPEAMAKWKRGTYRARSLEIGPYVTNDEAVYYPVVFGLAFVDLPAVEGLYGAHVDHSENHHYSLTDLQEDRSMSDTQPDTQPDEGGENQPNPQPETPPTAPAPNVQPDEGGDEGGENQPESPAAPASAPNTFSLNGRSTTDFAAVQAHINDLEKFRAQSIANGRRAAVAQWAKDGKMAQNQVDSLAAIAVTMTESQYEALRSSYEAAPSVSLLGRHSDDGVPSPGIESNEEEFELLVATIKNHKRAKLSDEKIALTPQYKKLSALCEARGERIEDHIDL